MTDRDQENGEPLSDQFEPGEDEFEEEQEAPAGGAAAEEAGQDGKEDRTGGRRFGRNRTPEEPARPSGSMRGSHAERVHIDDRVSAAFALVSALALILILLGSVVATHLPAGPSPTTAPLASLSFSVPVATATASASSSASASASASSSASASPSSSASASAS